MIFPSHSNIVVRMRKVMATTRGWCNVWHLSFAFFDLEWLKCVISMNWKNWSYFQSRARVTRKSPQGSKVTPVVDICALVDFWLILSVLSYMQAEFIGSSVVFNVIVRLLKSRNPRIEPLVPIAPNSVMHLSKLAFIVPGNVTRILHKR